jgi:hypothetical protein
VKCLVKSKIRKNSVSPSYSEAEIRKRNSRNSPGRKAPDPINPEDMVKQLEEGKWLLNILKLLNVFITLTKVIVYAY